MTEYGSSPAAARPRPSNADAVLAFIRCQIARGEPFPSQRAIADFMGWKTDRGVPPVMMCLRAAGHVVVKERHPSGRGWRYEWELADQVPSSSSLLIRNQEASTP